MGKNKKKQTKQTEEAKSESRPATAQTQASSQQMQASQEQPAQAQEVPAQPEVTTTPEERVAEYEAQQRASYNALMEGFAADDLMLASQADFSTKQAELDKVKQTELKKFEKTNKLAVLEFDDLLAQCKTEKSLQALHERAMKTLTDLCRKAAKKTAQNNVPAMHILTQVDQVKSEIEVNMKKRKTLQAMSELLMTKNRDLYLKHEVMLDEEKQKRVDLGASFQQRMALIQEQLTAEKEQRATQMEENTAIRNKIQEAINAYNVKEQAYQSQMKTYQSQMQGLEQKFKSQIEGKIQKQLVVAKKAKDDYDSAAAQCETLAAQIKTIVDKFDQIKVEINNSSKKMEDYKQEVEMKQTEIKLLETEIENQKQQINKKATLQNEIDQDGPKLQKQIDTFASLKKALEIQLQNA